MVRHCTCGLYFTRRWLVKYKSPLVQYLTILHSTPCNNIYIYAQCITHLCISGVSLECGAEALHHATLGPHNYICV